LRNIGGEIALLMGKEKKLRGSRGFVVKEEQGRKPILWGKRNRDEAILKKLKRPKKVYGSREFTMKV